MRLIAIVLGIALGSGPVLAQANTLLSPPPVLTLQAALDLTLAQNPDLLTTQRRLGVTQAERVIADVSPSPIVGLSTELLPNQQQYQVALVSQELELGGQRGARIAVAEQSLGVTERELQLTLWQLRSRVRTAYTQLVVAEAAGRELTLVAALNRRLLEVAELRFQVGDIPQLDVIRVQSELALAENEVEANQTRQQVAQALLNQILGQPLDTELTLEPIEQTPQFSLRVSTNGIPLASLLPAPPMTEPVILARLVQQALGARQDFGLLGRQQELARAQIQLAQANRVPNLNLGLGVLVETSNQSGETVVGPTFGFSVPLNFSNQGVGQIQRAEAELRFLSAQEQALQSRIAVEVTTAYRQFLLAHQQQERFAQVFLVNARELQRLSQLSYERGRSDLTTALLAQTQSNRVRQQYLQSLDQYQQSVSALEQAVGLPIES
ncbi:TolC family protein [Candidatus Cyanaurora vandensis]|uniref:TolC family protein n=1 Tax=Candidatus Cyanaurora vandensis TaxID=2714958 RepID=UPI00257ED818|nr:TolC family protein [Candidatus Cyanaurora vandensis]